MEQEWPHKKKLSAIKDYFASSKALLDVHPLPKVSDTPRNLLVKSFFQKSQLHIFAMSHNDYDFGTVVKLIDCIFWRNIVWTYSGEEVIQQSGIMYVTHMISYIFMCGMIPATSLNCCFRTIIKLKMSLFSLKMQSISFTMVSKHSIVWKEEKILFRITVLNLKKIILHNKPWFSFWLSLLYETTLKKAL